MISYDDGNQHSKMILDIKGSRRSLLHGLDAWGWKFLELYH